MITLGLTGGIGSGKSLASKFFGDLGACVVDADVEARRIMEEDEEVRAALIDAFGPQTFLPDGYLNRSWLGGRVFKDKEEVKHLNSIVHPALKAAFPQIREHAKKTGAQLLVYEAALLVEAGLNDRFDAIIVVDAPMEIRIKRVMARDNVSEEAVVARMQHQLPANVLREHADYILDNSGSPEDLQKQVEELHDRLVDNRQM